MNERWHWQWAYASGGVTMLRLQYVGRPPAAGTARLESRQCSGIVIRRPITARHLPVEACAGFLFQPCQIVPRNTILGTDRTGTV
jgi:hypothetical protein